MTTIALFLLVLYTNISYASLPALFRIFGGGGMAKSFDIGSKVITTQDALESIIERRNKKEILEFSAGKLYSADTSDDAIIENSNSDSIRKNAWNYANLAKKNKDKKLQRNAIFLYEKSLSIDANNWKTWHGYGWSLAEIGSFQRASNAFIVAIYLGGDSESWRHLGWNYQRQGHIKKAKYFYIKSLQEDPNNKASHAALSAIEETHFQTQSNSQLSISNDLKFTVQAGAFKSGESALRLKKELSTNLPIIINNQTDPSKYYVQIGSFLSKQEARLEKIKLIKDNPNNNFFVK